MEDTTHSIKMKNGDIINVSYEVYENIAAKVTKDLFISFTNQESKFFLTINCNEIVYIK